MNRCYAERQDPRPRASRVGLPTWTGPPNVSTSRIYPPMATGVLQLGLAVIIHSLAAYMDALAPRFHENQEAISDLEHRQE